MIFPFAIPAFSDNYIWLIAADNINSPGQADNAENMVVIIDPGTADPVIKCLQDNKLQPCAILVTHHCYDHTNGISALCQHYNLPVYGPANSIIPELSHPLHDNDEISLENNLSFQVMATPGHTLDHLCYYRPGMLFSGDTLFSAGCGRIKEGSPAQMFKSLTRLANLPDNTQIFCTHEYTLANLKFAQQVEPENNNIKTRLAYIQQQRDEGQITLPSTMAEEHRSNPFLRCSEPSVMAAASRFAQRPVKGPEDTFKIIRFWKDTW